MNNPPSDSQEDTLDQQVQQNLMRWQSGDDPLAPLSEEQLDLVYEVSDLLKNASIPQEPKAKIDANSEEDANKLPLIDSYKAFIKWLVSCEDKMKHENLKEFDAYHEELCHETDNCEQLYNSACYTAELFDELKTKYFQVTAKTDSLHNLSEQLMSQQRVLKEKKKSINEKLHYFLLFNQVQNSVDRLTDRVNSPEFIECLNNIDNGIVYLGDHMNFKESRIYKMKYESLLVTALNKVYRVVSNVIADATKQVLEPADSKLKLTPLSNPEDHTFSLYYGKFQSASTKVRLILNHLQEKSASNEQYRNIEDDCQKFYISQRLPVLSVAVTKALAELKEKNKQDSSVLFRSCGLFLMKTCQDEATCFHYFFAKSSPELNEYLGVLCQHLYDTLRPSLISINHVEILSELCGILLGEMLTDKATSSDYLEKFCEVIQQLLEDVEERLVFRTHVFFQHDLIGYKPSPGDLAYPEKLQQIENIVMELQEPRSESRNSVVSLESQEVASINSTSHAIAHFRSYTGNSPADLHGMWYPTVKRTLVILSRLYFCLDRSTFQSLAQEALLICIKTVQEAADLIAKRKSEIDGRLFQIKHLLIIREQIAPFQVDLTTVELSLDFSSIAKAAVALINNRHRLFTLGPNNALLEFLLEGTPKVKEYLIDSRKEIDKQLKFACETFITGAANVLTQPLSSWKKKIDSLPPNSKLKELDIGQARHLSDVMSETLRNIKTKVPDVQKSMQLYLANRETEFILFRPIRNNVMSVFVQVEHILSTAGYSEEELLLVACPSPEQINVMICSVSLAADIKN